jgi:flagellar biosynthetic protein FliR
VLAQFLQTEAFGFFLVFARIGAGLMLLPGFGETYVSPRIRLLLALGITLAVHPLVVGDLPAMPEDALTLFLVVLAEVLVGLFLGGAGRLMLSVLQMMGMLVAHATNLSAAQIFDPTQGSQGTITGNFLGILGVVLIFAANLHHLMLGALVDSYAVFPSGTMPPVDDFAAFAVRIVGDGFALSLQLAAPLIVVALIFQVGLGVLARLMPQMHVFFIGMPLQILLGFAVFAVTLGTAMTWYLDQFGRPFETLLAQP